MNPVVNNEFWVATKKNVSDGLLKIDRDVLSCDMIIHPLFNSVDELLNYYKQFNFSLDEYNICECKLTCGKQMLDIIVCGVTGEGFQSSGFDAEVRSVLMQNKANSSLAA